MCTYCVRSHNVANAVVIHRPLIGGTFVDFASKSIDSIPHGGVRSIFERNPYLLPNIVTTVLALLICGLAVGVLDEVCRVPSADSDVFTEHYSDATCSPSQTLNTNNPSINFI